MVRDKIACSLLEEQIIGNCNCCSLRKICDGVDKMAEEMRMRTNTVVKKFEFN